MRFVNTIAVVALFSGACSQNSYEAVSKPESPPATYDIMDYKVHPAPSTTAKIGETVVASAVVEPADDVPTIQTTTTEKIVPDEKLAPETLQATSTGDSSSELINETSQLNEAAVSIKGSVEAIGLSIVRFTEANPSAEPYPQFFPSYIVRQPSDLECGSAFSVRKNPEKQADFIVSMEYGGNLEAILNPDKVNGEAMWNGEIGHPEGALTEEASLDGGADLALRLTTLACNAYHEEKNNKIKNENNGN